MFNKLQLAGLDNKTVVWTVANEYSLAADGLKRTRTSRRYSCYRGISGKPYGTPRQGNLDLLLGAFAKLQRAKISLEFKLSPCCECCILSFWCFPGVWIL